MLPFSIQDKPKNYLLFLAFFLPQCLFSQNGLSWSPAVSPAPASLGGSSPRIALLSDGTPVAVWGKAGTTPQIWCARWTGTAFSAPVQVNTGSIKPGVYDFGGLDMATFGQRVFVVFEDFDLGIYLARSDDGGITWQPPVTVFATPAGMGNTLPAIAVDAAGNPIITFLLQTASETDAHVELARSTDGGLTFSEYTNASAPAANNSGQACECCNQDILTAGADTVFVAFRANRNNLRDMWVTRSIDSAGTFTAACDVDAQDWVINSCPTSGPSLIRTAGDVLLSVWMSKGSGSTRVYASTLHSGSMVKGSELEMPASSPAAIFNQNHPDVAGSNDTIAMVWEETGFSGTGQDLVVAFSTTGADGLNANLAVQSETGTQKVPQIVYAGGVFHLLYTNGVQGLLYRRGTVVAPSATKEAELEKKRLTVWPNPTVATLFFDTGAVMPENVLVRIFDAAGLLVLEKQMATTGLKGQIETESLQSGVYSIMVVADAQIHTATFLRL
jgi:hypothetical protein